jgi:hypothetical protein
MGSNDHSFSDYLDDYAWVDPGTPVGRLPTEITQRIATYHTGLSFTVYRSEYPFEVQLDLAAEGVPSSEVQGVIDALSFYDEGDSPFCFDEAVPVWEFITRLRGFLGDHVQLPDTVQSVQRQLTSHMVNGCNETIRVDVMDAPGDGGACHDYRVTVLPSWSCHPRHDGLVASVRFQNGPVKERGANGLTNEALLAILIDRMEGFQSGQFACHDNQMALDHLQSARLWLHKRTMDRVARGVEGTHAK